MALRIWLQGSPVLPGGGVVRPSPFDWLLMEARSARLAALRLRMEGASRENRAAAVREGRGRDGEQETDGGEKAGEDEGPRPAEKKKEKRKAEATAAAAARGIDVSAVERPETLCVVAEYDEEHARKKQKSKRKEHTFGLNSRDYYLSLKRRVDRSGVAADDAGAGTTQDELEHDASVAGGDHLPTHGVPTHLVDRMVHELNEHNARGKRFATQLRNKVKAGDPIDAVSLRNDNWNRKLERAYGKHVQDIKANLERGTALPE